MSQAPVPAARCSGEAPLPFTLRDGLADSRTISCMMVHRSGWWSLPLQTRWMGATPVGLPPEVNSLIIEGGTLRINSMTNWALAAPLRKS